MLARLKAVRKVFIKIIRNKRNYRDDLDLLIDGNCEHFKEAEKGRHL